MSDRDRRTLLIGASAVIGMVAISRGVPALKEWETGRITAAATAAQGLSELRGGRASIAVLRDSLRARKTRLATLDSVLITGKTPAEIAAGLASTLSDLADDNAVKVSAMQLHSDSLPKAGLARAEVRVTGVTDVVGLAGLLHAVEGGATPLRVRDLSVSQPDPAAPQMKPEVLRIDLLVETLGAIKGADIDSKPAAARGDSREGRGAMRR